MKLTYWYCECLTDSDVYSIRTKTKREATESRDREGTELYGEPIKVTMFYSSGFNLMAQCSDEGHHFWEEKA